MLALQGAMILGIEILSYAWAGSALAYYGGWSAGGIALWALSVALMLRLASVLVSYAISRRYARGDRPPSLRVGPARIVAMLGLEWWATTVLFTILQPLEKWLGLRDPARGPAEGALPVLLVHGYICNGAYWWPLIRYLHRRGIHGLYTINLEPVYASIDRYAAPIARRVEAILTNTGADRVIVVAHSMGGLAARTYLRSAAGRSRVAKLITLGSPHHGTVMARAAPTRNAIEMRPGSAFLAELDRSDRPARGSMTCIYSLDDNIVYPQHAQVLEGATNIAVSGVCHVAMCFSRRIQNLVYEQLRSV